MLTDGTGVCVKPIAFERPYRKLGTMEQYVNTMESRDVDELIIIDIEATKEGRKPNYEKLRSWCNNLFCPVTYGGGISSLDDIRLALENGADKVAIKTNNLIIGPASRKFGAQAIVAVIDVDVKDQWHNVAEYAMVVEQDGAGEILLTDMERDGKLDGYFNQLIGYISEMVSIPVISLGGCADPSHMAEALDAGASAVAAGSMFLYTDWTPKSCARYLSDRGYAVRL